MIATEKLSERVHAGQTPHVRHVYCPCTRGQNARIAYCGHTSGPTLGDMYNPKMPDLCAVCNELVQVGCSKCGAL